MSSYQQTMGSYEGSSYARAFPAQYNAELPQADGQFMSVPGIPGEVRPELPKADPFRRVQYSPSAPPLYNDPLGQLRHAEVTDFVDKAAQNRLRVGSSHEDGRNNAYNPHQHQPTKPKSRVGWWFTIFAVFLALFFILMMVLAAFDYPHDERDGRRFGRFRRLCRIE